ncbi:protein serine/threonine phosphatase 2C [Cystobasidium minutum MCA 4210]|uniref:protein serine/threonine phosphatase 2C n=1 Tax=Cystobasidium minutum MCA 4210 TaxID=1397322 RepID=UPI0034CEC764|eukprot:jgi/Rhomi1/168677/fgenesh1_kg.3_\
MSSVQQEAGVAGEQQHQQVQSPESDGSSSRNNTPSHPTLPPEVIQSSQQQQHHHSSRRDFAKMRRPSSPNASSAPITQASGAYTGGVVNRHPNSDAVQQESQAASAGGGANSESGAAASADGAPSTGNQVGSESTPPTFRVGVSEDRNQKCRRTMEDSHAFVYDFGGVQGQGYFAVFDGHAGKHAAEWCGANFHKYLLNQLKSGEKDQPIPDLLNATFHVVDSELSKLAAEDGTHSGCTAVTAFLRLEDENGNAVETDEDPDHTVGSSVTRGGAGHAIHDSNKTESPAPMDENSTDSANNNNDEERKRKFGDGSHRERFKSLFGSSSSNSKDSTSSSPSQSDINKRTTSITGESEANVQAAEGVQKPARAKNMARRTLYTANVGDARAVLSRGGKAVRLTYDHKGSDAQEAKRITDAGGFVMNNRVNGVLAVTRSLGDSSMKEFVVGSPYTTETTLGDEDDYLIIACDGLWDVCEDQTAVDLIRDVKDAQEASQVLLEHALSNFSTDNLSVLVVALQADRVR